MPATAHVKGLILEEVVLFLLRAAGYRTIDAAGTDPTLGTCAAGLQVKGRGGEHQIDAIADFAVGQPFSHSQRLLVEAKCYGVRYPVGLPLVRNAVGVLKDVSEFWASPRGGSPHKSRYHYQFALFSTSAFTVQAQRYAFAHDIHLLPVRGSAFFAPIVREIVATSRRIEQSVGPVRGGPFPVVGGRRRPTATELRGVVRAALQPHLYPHSPEHEPYGEVLGPLVEACRRLDGAIIAMIANSFPVFLVPAPGLRLEELDDIQNVRITWDQHGWYLVSALNREDLFSFDLPAELFGLYADAGILNPLRALDLKEDYLSEIQAVSVMPGNRIRLLHFRLDREWLEEVRARVTQTYQPSEEDVQERW